MTGDVHKQKSGLKHLDFIVADLICVYIAYVVSYYVRFPAMLKIGFDFRYPEFIVAYFVVFIGISFMLNLHSGILRRGLIDEFKNILLTCFLSLVGTIFVLYAFHESNKIPRLMMYIMQIVMIPLMFAERVVWKNVIRKKIRRSRALFIISDIEHATEIINRLYGDIDCVYDIRGVALAEGTVVSDIEGIPVVSDFPGANEYICHEWVDDVLLMLPKGKYLADKFFSACNEMNITVHNVLAIEDADIKKISVGAIADHKVLTTGYYSMTFNQMILKRVMDIIGGIIGCILCGLILLFVGPMIYIASPGPIIFKQKRVGMNGKIFKFYKVRSMVLNADEIKKQYEAENRVKDGLMFKMVFDPRIIGNKILPDGTQRTGIGQFIRKTSLDEFPQFLNVLKGDMSLVGTRPPTIDEWERYDLHHRARLTMKPGITGLWQVSGRSAITDFEEVVKLDTKYINNFSLKNDLKILIKTVVNVFKHDGAM